MRILVVGSAGMLGTDVVSEVRSRGWDAVEAPIEILDITDPVSVAKLAAGAFGNIDWCVNCAAYTAVDKAEEESDLAMAVNGLGPSYLSRACAASNCRLLHVSTDFVFDGTMSTPYEPDDLPNPQSAYGRSKLHGEEGALSGSMDAMVVRTSWLFGPKGNSFPRTMINAWTAGKHLRVVADQIGTPTYTADLARVICEMIAKKMPGGIYHAAGPNIMSWFDFAKLTLETYRDRKDLALQEVSIEPISTSDWPTPAKRPAYSALSFQKLLEQGIAPMRSISDAISEFIQRV